MLVVVVSCDVVCFVAHVQISNTSELSVEYYIKMDSQSLLRYSKAQETPFFIKRQRAKYLIGETFEIFSASLYFKLSFTFKRLDYMAFSIDRFRHAKQQRSAGV